MEQFLRLARVIPVEIVRFPGKLMGRRQWKPQHLKYFPDHILIEHPLTRPSGDNQRPPFDCLEMPDGIDYGERSIIGMTVPMASSSIKYSPQPVAR